MTWSGRLKRMASLLLRLSLGGAGLLYVFIGLDLAALSDILLRYSYTGILFLVVLSFGVYTYLGYRLASISHHRSDVRVGTLATIVCHGFNNLLPTKLGELAKVLYMCTKSELTKAEALGVVFWERFLDLNALLVMALWSMLLMDHQLYTVPLVGLIGGMWVVLFALHRWEGVRERLIALFPVDALKGFLRELHGHVNTRLNRSFLLRMGGQTALVWALYAAQSLLTLMWVAGLDLSLGEGMVVFIVSGLSMTLPSTPGALGVFEAAVVLALGWYGIPKEEAVAAAVVMHMIEYVPTILATLWVMMRTDFSWSVLRREEDDQPVDTSPLDGRGKGEGATNSP